MKYSNFNQSEKGICIKGHSKFLEFILSFYARRIIKKARKKDLLPMSKKIKTNIELFFDLEVLNEK